MIKWFLPLQAAVLFNLLFATTTLAQTWVQIEAQPSAAQAIERARFFSQTLPDVNAFSTGSRWNAVVIGPFPTEAEARRELAALRAARRIPGDSFIVDGRAFRDRLFGTGLASTTAPRRVEPLPEIVLEAGEETLEEARRNERDLSRDDRALIQTALKFAGFYNSTIDASFGRGTRGAMGDWQVANGYESTRVLTTLQRQELVQSYLNVIDSLGIAPVEDPLAGIALELPVAMVGFDRYEAPFAHYEPITEDGVKVVLISVAGDQTTLNAYYDLMQTLEIVPPDGDRTLGRESFTIQGVNDRIRSHTFVRRAGDAIKGFTLAWPVGDDRRFEMALDAMRASFRTDDAILPANQGVNVQDIDLMAGLEIRRPERNRSGFFVARDGTVLTTHAAVSACGYVTIEDNVPVDIVAQNQALGLALLQPEQALSPLAIASLQEEVPRLASDVAVAGYSFGGLLSSPSLTFGTVSDIKGLDGDRRVSRLALMPEPGDAGGPVLDSSGNVLGMLLDPPASGTRQLPAGVAFAVQAPVLTDFLGQNGVSTPVANGTETMAPEDLTVLAADVTVLVSCWN